MIHFLCHCPEVLITKFRLRRLYWTCAWNCAVHDIKRSDTYWLSMNFSSVLWSKNMCIREEFLKVGFVWPYKTYEGLFPLGTSLQLSKKRKYLISDHYFSWLNCKILQYERWKKFFSTWWYFSEKVRFAWYKASKVCPVIHCNTLRDC